MITKRGAKRLIASGFSVDKTRNMDSVWNQNVQFSQLRIGWNGNEYLQKFNLENLKISVKRCNFQKVVINFLGEQNHSHID